MKTLYKWHLTHIGFRQYMAHGVVYGHSSPNCADGSEIHTSLIESAEYDGETIALFTMNSEYRLSIAEMDCENYDAMRSLRIFERFAREFGLMMCLPQVTSHYMELDRYLSETRAEIHSRLKDGSLYLELTDGNPAYYGMAVYRNSGGNPEFMPIMSDCYIDSKGKFTITVNYIADYRPYSDGNIEFTARSKSALPDKEFLGIIKNNSCRTLNIRFSWGKTVILAPECEIVVSEGIGLAIPLTSTEPNDYSF